MPRSQRPRKPYRDKFVGEYKPPAPKPARGGARPPSGHVPPAPEVPHFAPRPARLRGRTGILVGAGAAGAGGAAFLAHRRRSGVKKMLDPFSGEVVEFGKAAPNVDDPMFGTDVRSVAPRTPEGPGVSHENKLLVLGTRKRSKKPPPALVSFKANKSQSPNFAKSLQGAAVKGERGTPMSSMAHNGRVGRKLRVV